MNARFDGSFEVIFARPLWEIIVASTVVLVCVISINELQVRRYLYVRRPGT